MSSISRRDFALAGISKSALLSLLDGRGIAFDNRVSNVHDELLHLAHRQEAERRAAFAAVKTIGELAKLQATLREKFLRLIGGLPERTTATPPAKIVAQIDGGDCTI